jgi:hypothetical protein
MSVNERDAAAAKELFNRLTEARIRRAYKRMLGEGKSDWLAEEMEQDTPIIAAALAQARSTITPEARTMAENVYQSWLNELQDPETRVKPADEAWLKTLFALTISRLKVHYSAQLYAMFDSSSPPDVLPLRWVGGKMAAPEGCILDDQGVVRKDPNKSFTSDGKPIKIGSRVWFNDDIHDPVTTEWAEVSAIADDVIKFRPVQRITWMYANLCYSTREAAEAAKDNP